MRKVSKAPWILGAVSLSLGGGFYWWRRNDFVIPEKFPGRDAMMTAQSRVSGMVKAILQPFVDPSTSKLLPDFPRLPPGSQAPRTLILALEDTLIKSDWDRRYGSRAIKRPGLDKFLAALAQSYEIVVFSKAAQFDGDPIITKLDSLGCVSHRLFKDATRYVDGAHKKDASLMNRDLSRVIMIDVSPEAVDMNPDNAVLIPAFGGDEEDTVLVEDVLPLLQAIVQENVKDVRVVLSEYRKDGAGDVLAAFRSKFREAKAEVMQERRRGLGGQIRSRAAGVVAEIPEVSTPQFIRPTAAPSDLSHFDYANSRTRNRARVVDESLSQSPAKPPSSEQEDVWARLSKDKKKTLWQNMRASNKEYEKEQREMIEAWMKEQQQQQQQK